MPTTVQATQKLDEEYTRRIREHSTEKRAMTELVDHMPVSDSVPSPLKFLGYIPGEPGKVTYHADIVRYLEALDKASDRVTLWRIGKSDEGRDMVSVAIADEATIKQLDKYKQITRQLSDPRALNEVQARQLIQTGKPIYYALGSIHSTEMGSPEMLMELAFRLTVEESPFIQTIRNNTIFVFTPATEVDGREKRVDNFRAQAAGQQAPGMVYWGKYVAHDNNRDAIGLGLRLTQVMMKTFLDWRPTVWHDLHESVTLLYTSTGTGPYNTIVDAIQVDEWWLLAKTEIMEMTKRGVPGIWTYNFYDGWVPNYLFWLGVTHNSIGRFYETQSFTGQNYNVGGGQSREWYRPNPTPPNVQWGPRSNVNMQQSAILFALNHVAKNKETFLENYFMKNKRAVERGQAGTELPRAYVLPNQKPKGQLADMVNLLRLQGCEVHTATAAFKVGDVAVNAGDYIVRMDQPYSPVVETLLGVQWYAPENPRPYDDTGWYFPGLRNVKAIRIEDAAIFKQPMTLMIADAKVAGAVIGNGRHLIVEHTTDNSLMTWRLQHAAVKMLAAEREFDAGNRKFGAGAFIVPEANRAALEPTIREAGLTAVAVDTLPDVPTHELDVPRIGYIHSWQNTQNEGWVRLAFDYYKVPYTYFGDNEVRRGNLRQRFDVIVYPDGPVQAETIGLPGGPPQPYKKTELTPNLGVPDTTEDMRGGLGRDGLRELQRFVEEGGLLITEGSTSRLFPDYRLTMGVSVEQPEGLWAPGSVFKTVVGDRTSPVLYGYDQNALAVYYRASHVFNVGGGAGGGGRGGRGGAIPGVGGGNLNPNAVPPRLTTLDGPPAAAGGAGAGRGGAFGGRAGGGGRGAGGGGRGGGGRGGGAAADPMSPRVLLSFPNDANDLLLSGGLVGGEALTGRALVVDAPVGKGHVVMFANRPFWRWETHGNFFMVFNAMLNWNDLGAGR
jgi:hypothetical protein